MRNTFYHRPDSEYDFQVGDRVRVVRDFYNYELVPVGSEGTVWSPYINTEGRPFILRTSHADSNGGGHDIHVRLDGGREISVRVEGRTTYIERI